MSAAAPLLTPPTKCYCKFEKQHFLILADVFNDMSKNCSDLQFSNTLKTSSAVFADMAIKCSESRSDARAGEVVPPQSSQKSEKLEAQYRKAIENAAEARAKAKAEAEARAAADAKAAAEAFKQPTSDEKFKTRGSNVGFNYARIIREINEVLTSEMKSQQMKDKYRLLKPKLEQAQTYADVEKILNDENVKWDSNKITSGGTRKRRLKKTLRKRSKKTKKAGKRK